MGRNGFVVGALPGAGNGIAVFAVYELTEGNKETKAYQGCDGDGQGQGAHVPVLHFSGGRRLGGPDGFDAVARPGEHCEFVGMWLGVVWRCGEGCLPFSRKSSVGKIRRKSSVRKVRRDSSVGKIFPVGIDWCHPVGVVDNGAVWLGG